MHEGQRQPRKVREGLDLLPLLRVLRPPLLRNAVEQVRQRRVVLERIVVKFPDGPIEVGTQVEESGEALRRREVKIDFKYEQRLAPGYARREQRQRQAQKEKGGEEAH